MKARKIIITAGAGAAFLLCLAGFVFAYNAYAKASKVKTTLDATYKQLQSIYSANPFPNATNMAVLRSDAVWMSNWYRLLVAELRETAATNADLSSSGLIMKMQDTSTELHKQANASGGKVLPDGFAFGFDRYLGGSRRMPKPENVKRLALQFTMMEAITREILDSRVAALTRIDREEFESDGAEKTAATGKRPRQQPAPVAAPVVAAEDARYPRQRFTVGFTADEKALAEVLSRMAKMPLFVVVTEVSVDRVSRGLQPRLEKPVVETDKARTAVILPTQRVVSGPEIAPLLKAQMMIDVYTFEGA
ncbi:MAG: Amuc_1100 family pilus-like protein [bacterium]